jgi:hypothetical protein
MSHDEPSSDRKRKAVEESEVAIHSDDRNPKKSKAPTTSLDSMTLSQIDSLHGGKTATKTNPKAKAKSQLKAKPLTERAKKAQNARETKYLTRIFSNTDKGAVDRYVNDPLKAVAECEAESKLPASERYSRKGVPVPGRRIEGRCPNCQWDGRADSAPSKVHLLADLEPPTFELAGIEYVDYDQEWPSVCRSSWNQQRKHHEQKHIEIARENWPLALRDRQSRRGLPLTTEEKKQRRRDAQREVRKHKREVEEKEKETSSPSSSEEEQGQEEQEDEEEQDQEEQEDEGEKSASNTPEQEASMRRIEKMIQDLSGSNNEKVVTALIALSMDIRKDPTTRNNMLALDGCDALLQLLKNCLDRAIGEIPACDQVTKLNELAELTTLNKTLRVVTNLTFRHEESKVGITAIGGVEAVVKVMKTFPKCHTLQDNACIFLLNLTCHNRATGKKRAAESGGIEVLVAAINNHLGSPILCGYACRALRSIIRGNKKNAEQLKCLGGEAAISKIWTKWPDLDKAHGVLQYLTAHMTSSRPTVRNSCKSSEVVIASPKVLAFSSQPPEPKARPELVSQQPKNDHKCKSTGAPDAANTNAYQESSSAPFSSQAPVTSRSLPVVEEPTSRLQHPSPFEEQGTVLAVESSTEKRAEPQAEVQTEVQPSTSTKHDEIVLERQESVAQDVFPIDNNDQVRHDNTNGDDDASLAPIPSIQAPEAVVGRYDCKCKNTFNVTILEATDEGESNATKVVTRNIYSLRERKPQNARLDTTERDSAADTGAAFNTEGEDSTSNADPVDQIQSIGTLVQDILYSDNVAFGAALYALHVDLVKDLTRWDYFVAVSGCFAVVPIMWFVVKELICWVFEESG